MAEWFLCTVKRDKTLENGQVKKVSEKYLFDSLSFTESESRCIEKITPFVSGEIEVADIKRTKIANVIPSSMEKDDKYFKVKVNYIELDEWSGAEKKSAQYNIVQASDLRCALEYFEKWMSNSMADYEIASIQETHIIDVYKYVPKTEKETDNE